MDSRQLRLRFAPSPTGPIHVGNAHTMLFNWLWCRSQGGRFVLRFEDTDQERSRPEWEEVIVSEMRWLGLDWDEGPDIGGPYAPYRQMARMDLYREYLERLRQRGAVYPCYCTREEVDAERRQADGEKRTYRYSRRCLGLTPSERAAKEAEGVAPAWRLRVPDDEVVAYEDLLRGRIEFPSQSIGDPVIMRANGTPLYNLAVVVDDITMHITDVLRGEGHISNTPVQVLIYRALGIEPPRFVHCSHLLTAGRGKIAKRKGELSVTSFRELGILGEALFNYMALLGWAPEGEGRDVLSREEVVREFDIQRVNRAAAVFDEEKLEWLNGVYLRRQSREQFAELALPFVVQAALAPEAALRANWPWFVAVTALVQERVRVLSEVPSAVSFFFQDDMHHEEDGGRLLTDAMRPFVGRVADSLSGGEWSLSAIEGAVRGVMAEARLGAKAALQPLRVLVSGRTVSPPLFDMIYLLGRERTLARLGRWLGGGK